MSQVVYKYSIPVNDEFTLDLPFGARPLSVQVQRGELQLWALVDPNAEPHAYRFRLAGTGHPIEGDWSYVGTVQLLDGDLVFHLFWQSDPQRTWARPIGQTAA